MSPMDDDPREVLALLNSLGFVGVTAPQLKAFMKDLKLYRKIKEREKLQRKEELRKKILTKQESMIKEILREESKEFNTLSSDSSNFQPDDSLIKVRVRCVSEDEPDPIDKKSSRESNKENVRAVHRKVQEKGVPLVTGSRSRAGQEVPVKQSRSDSKNVEGLTRRLDRHRIDVDSNVNQARPVSADARCPRSEADLTERAQDRISSAQARSTSSVQQTSRSKSKSFIRPWRLQPDARRSTTSKKSDPVTLYQKYQQDWKQMSFPGEAKHAGIRWAVREKMLGADPHPLPLQRKPASSGALKGK